MTACPEARSMTGAVDLVLPLASIPDALVKFHRRMALTRAAGVPDAADRPSGLAARDHRPSPGKHFPRFPALQGRARCGAGSSAAWQWQRSRPTTWQRYLDVLRSDAKELDHLATDLLINVTSFFRDPKVFELLAEKIIPDLVRSHSVGSAAARLDRRVQHGRGNLFSRHALPRGDHGGEAGDQAADLCLRCRCRRGRHRPRRALPGNDRGRRVARKADTLLFEGRSRLPDSARIARHDRLRGAGRPGRPAVLAPRPDFVPESADLSAPRGAGKGDLLLPLRLARRRHSAAGKRRDDREFQWPLRGHLESRAALSAHRTYPAGRSSASCSEPIERRAAAGPRDHRASPRRGKPRSPRAAVASSWRPMRPRRC